MSNLAIIIAILMIGAIIGGMVFLLVIALKSID